ncbi:ABC transporter substrate-binding protein [Kaustia mangrovi]|uniref:ABC transporter substrate-binding protein n=1 Tax=Kaustia mangrovi TaxID=2593653 RepID=A0A7S8C2X8_9HYPH|nr:ABC transporter substrate-binding protein [Kaustia mangrovi]QPC42400.1 ABC transporter substrate-binding protein [Kaustia mangrovi]
MRFTTLLALATAMAIAAPAALTQASEIRVGFTNDADTLDPANHRKRETETILRNMYDGILTRDGDMTVVPELAESFRQVSPTVYEFTLRKGVTFHDGSELTAEDVKFTLDRITVEGAMDGRTSPRKSLLGPVEEIEIVDDRTIRIHLGEPWPILPAMLPFQEVVSKAFVEKVGTDGLATQVNGTGPFRLVDWRRGDSVIMERFDGYYGGADDIAPVGKACVDRVIFKVIPENASRVAALLAGDVDIINDLPAHSVAQVKNNPGTDVVTANGTRSFFVALNTQGDIFDDPKVRQAAMHAIDKDLIIDRILAGNAVAIEGILSPDAFGHNRELTVYDYDPELARAMLAEAGYPDGVDLQLDTEGAYKDVAEAVASLLTKAGFRTTVVVGEGSQLSSKWRTRGGEKTGDMYFTSWGNGSLDPYGIFVPTHRTNDRGNSAGYSNPALDEILDEAGVEADTEKRAALYRKAEAIVNEDLPYLYLWVPQDIYGVSRRLKGWKPSPDSRINLHDACVD